MTQPGLEHNSSSTTNQTKAFSSNHLQNHNGAHSTATEKPGNVPSSPSKSPNNDILLNTFQMKKKRYRVLLNNDHIVWEAFHPMRNAEDNDKSKQKETEYESEQLSQKAAYGSLSTVVHINSIIRVTKGNTKHAATKIKVPNQHQQSPIQEVSMLQHQLAAPSTQYSSPPTEQYLCIHYAEHLVISPNDCNRWRVRSLTLYNSDPYLVRQWHSMLTKKLSALQPQRVKRLLVFINPYGGRKQGLQTYEQHCKPLFLLAGIDPSCIISQRANQIRDILMSHDLQQYDAVCCVGGDGTVAEVINGLLFRAMLDNKLDMQNPAYIPKPFLPLGIIPAGSTDTIAYSVHGTSDVRTAAIHLILSQRRGLDVCSVRNRNGIVRFCASVLSYGYLGDVAAKSEKYRWMGTKRYEYTGVKAFLKNQGYNAEIRILLPDNEEQLASTSSNAINQSGLTTPQNSLDSPCYVNCQRCSFASTLTPRILEGRQYFIDCQSDEDEDLGNSKTNDFKDPDEPDRFDDSLNCDNNLMANVLDKGNPFKDIPNLQEEEEEEEEEQQQQQQNEENKKASNFPSSTSISSRKVKLTAKSPSFDTDSSYSNNNLDPEKLKVIKGQFFMISGANITCACSRSPNGISRYCHLGDGYLDLILVRKTSLLNNVRFLINTMGQNGDIRNLPFVEVYRTRSFSFRSQHLIEGEEYCYRGSCQPIANAHNDDLHDHLSSWNCDGEVVNDLEITMSSHCQLVDVFMRGPSAYQKPTQEAKHSIFCCCQST